MTQEADRRAAPSLSPNLLRPSRRLLPNPPWSSPTGLSQLRSKNCASGTLAYSILVSAWPKLTRLATSG